MKLLRKIMRRRRSTNTGYYAYPTV